jgi:hypothetical protein
MDDQQQICDKDLGKGHVIFLDTIVADALRDCAKQNITQKSSFQPIHV